MKLELTYARQIELEKDIRAELDSIKEAAEALDAEIAESEGILSLRMSVAEDVVKVQEAYRVFSDIVEQLDTVAEECTGHMVTAESMKVLQRIFRHCMHHMIHRLSTAKPQETAVIAKLLELYRYA